MAVAKLVLAATWKNLEDALLFDIALNLCADAIISRNPQDFEADAIRVCSSSEFLAWLESERGISYARVAL